MPEAPAHPLPLARMAAASDVAIAFVHQWTHEGADAPNRFLPGNQGELVSAVAEANPHTIEVLETGEPVLRPRLSRVSAVPEAWYPGRRGRHAIAILGVKSNCALYQGTASAVPELSANDK